MFLDRSHYFDLLLAMMLAFGAGQTAVTMLTDSLAVWLFVPLAFIVASTIALIALIVRRVLREEQAIRIRLAHARKDRRRHG